MTDEEDVLQSIAEDDFIPGSDAALTPQRTALRVWPAALLILGMILCRLMPSLAEGVPMVWMFSSYGPLVCSVLMLLWWITFSRASVGERIIGTTGLLSAFGITVLAVHPSMLWVGVGLLTIPVGVALFGLAAIIVRRQMSVQRTFIMVLLAAVGFGWTVLVRANGMRSDYTMAFPWRWTPTIEERLLADRSERATGRLADFRSEDVERWIRNPDWSCFRGGTGGIQDEDLPIATDWTTHPPQLLWKIPVGPGWSSFAVAGELLFTQEQRGSDETVVCYAADTGKELWTQSVPARFEEPLGGPGPRATPTLAGGRLYVQGASGHVLCLDPRSGDILWQQDLKQLAQREPPTWGFASSPLVIESRVIVYAGGSDDRGVFALNADTGHVQWSAPAGDHSYSSPESVVLLNRPSIAMLTNDGLHLYDPASGSVHLNYSWPCPGYRAVQPHVVGPASILLPTGSGMGTRRIDLAVSDDGLTASERWTSMRLKPDFNDFVVHRGYAWGFDNRILTCIDLDSGKARWKGGRYGKGQLMLLSAPELLLVLGEKGQLVLVPADPSGHRELARIQALSGKTWNHPVVTNDRLFVRNAQEAACWRLPLLSRPEFAGTEH